MTTKPICVSKSNSLSTRCFQILIAQLLLAILLGCATKEERKARHLERAQQYVAEEKYKDAVLELKNAIQLDPNNDDIVYQLGETYMKAKEVDSAARSYADAIKINPDNMKAHLELGKILISARKTLGARIAAKSILDKIPNHIEALQLLAAVQIQEDNLAGAIKTLQRAAKADPTQIKPRLFLAEVLAFSGDTDKAERTYLQSISIDPSNPVPYIKLARLYGDKGKWDKILVVLNQMGQVSGKGYRSLVDLAQFCESHQKWNIAETIYIKAAGAAPADDVGPLVTLGTYYARRGAHNRALEIMHQAIEVKQNDPTILSNIANIQIELGNLDAAEKSADNALEIDGEHALANYAKGRIYFLKKDFTRALTLFDQTIKKNPQNAMAYYYKALCQLGRGMRGQSGMDLFRAAAGQYDDEDAWINKLALANLHMAQELDPNLLKVRLVLAGIYLGQRDTEKAREQIEGGLALAPGYLKTVALLGSLKLMEGDFKGAEAVCKKVLEKRPDLSLWHARLGMVYSAMKRSTDALKAYQRALELDPGQFSVLKSIVNIHLLNKNFEEALDICEKQKGNIQENRILLARIENLKGIIYRVRGEPETAIQYFRKAMALAPDLIAPRMALAEMFAQEDRLDEAVSQYEDVLALNAEYLPACMALGYIYYKQGDKKLAEKYYRQVLAIKGDYGPAANNLAFILSENDRTLHEAYRLAQLAEKKMPRDASVKDTLGWLYYRVGEYTRAIDMLEKSVAIDPTNAQANFHLGLAYYQNQEFDKAWRYLREALKLDSDFEGAKEARALLD